METRGPRSADKLQQFLQQLIAAKKKPTFRVVIFTHRQADPDALCSANALSNLLKIIATENLFTEFYSDIVAPGGASQLASSVCKKLEITFREQISSSELAAADLLAVVDAGGPRLLGEYFESVNSSNSSKITIDHHHQAEIKEGESSWPGFDFVLVNSDATSTSEIIATQFDSTLIDARTARALLVGVLFDSQHLGIANESTLFAALTLVRRGARIEEGKSILRSQADRSETIARLKSAQRISFVEVHSYFVAQTEVSSFHASVARMLVDVGSDVGIAFGESAGEGRISLRSSQRFFRETKIDLGQLLNGLAQQLGALGGGHSTAASISGQFEANKVVEQITEKIKSVLPQI